MHGRFYNEAILELTLRPRTPLLIKSGEAGRSDIDPTLPDMFFVRTRLPGADKDTIYIPGSSFRGVLRSHAEKLARSIRGEPVACLITETEKGCIVKKAKSANKKIDKMSGEEAYRASCYACRLFGNTGLSARIRVGDFYPDGDPLTETRYGVAIDRVTSAVAHGPFQLETVTDGLFAGVITLRNFTLGQLGLVSAALLDIADGLVPLGHGKSRGLGRVSIEFRKADFRFLRDPRGALLGTGALCDESVREKYFLPGPEEERLEVSAQAQPNGAFFVLEAHGEQVRQWIESVIPRWVEEVEAWKGE